MMRFRPLRDEQGKVNGMKVEHVMQVGIPSGTPGFVKGMLAKKHQKVIEELVDHMLKNKTRLIT